MIGSTTAMNTDETGRGRASWADRTVAGSDGPVAGEVAAAGPLLPTQVRAALAAPVGGASSGKLRCQRFPRFPNTFGKHNFYHRGTEDGGLPTRRYGAKTTRTRTRTRTRRIANFKKR